ncbi:hypothetical protein [uncultured Clostridium sp.]|uniref:hypothetical protein n=1 Tax=uncultured Clostridium sp. TaxID=59620 RepID=UPI00266EF2F7|nr:hypothetical protein [uncultured Clostridium sp.]
MNQRNNLREIDFLDEHGEQYEGFFHQWILFNGVQGIVEDIDGRILLIDYKDIQFK